MRSIVALATVFGCVENARAEGSSCGQHITRQDVVRCALAASTATRAERDGLDAALGRERSARTLLPSNPVLSFSGDRRQSDQQAATNWYGTLAQELEIGGQRRARRAAAASERHAQEASIAASEREVAATALRVYYEVLAARDALQLAERMEQSFEAAGAAARAAAESGASAGIEADLADVATVRLSRARIEAQRQHAALLAELTTLLGLDPTRAQPSVEGELEPLGAVTGQPEQLARQAVEKRPEVTGAAATQASFSSRAEAARRSRVPNLTVSLFAQRDGFDERVLGAGVSVPLTLPAPLGQNHAGEIAEHEAEARRSAALLEQTRRDIRLDVAQASEARTAAAAALALYTPERLARAAQTLAAIHGEVARGRVAISSVIVQQEALITFLHEHVEARLALCLASVELAHSTGSTLEGDAP